MAGIPLNTFKTVNKVVPYRALTYPITPPTAIPDSLVYTAPPGTSGVILYAQCANTDENNIYQISIWHYRANQFPSSFTELLVGAYVPTQDALVVLGGKLVLETGDAVYVVGTSNTNKLKLTLSILESANQ